MYVSRQSSDFLTKNIPTPNYFWALVLCVRCSTLKINITNA